jgi:integrase/recombinase XerD
MSTLRELLQDYLAMRRALGFKLRTEGTALSSFVTFMEQAQADSISTDLALDWAKQATSVQPTRWAQRLSYVRGFARYCSAIDPRMEIPPLGLLGSNQKQAIHGISRSPAHQQDNSTVQAQRRGE